MDTEQECLAQILSLMQRSCAADGGCPAWSSEAIAKSI